MDWALQDIPVFVDGRMTTMVRFWKIPSHSGGRSNGDAPFGVEIV
jgi:hypothetical protein